jgi:hypothetical protein
MAVTKKPFGITATAVYAAFSGLVCLLAGLIFLIASQTPAVSETPNGSAVFTAGGLFLCVLGVFFLASVYGLWSLQEWGRVLTLWLSGISIVLGFISIFPIWPEQQFTVSNTILQLVGIGIYILIITYLSKKHIKGLFNSEQP